MFWRMLCIIGTFLNHFVGHHSEVTISSICIHTNQSYHTKHFVWIKSLICILYHWIPMILVKHLFCSPRSTARNITISCDCCTWNIFTINYLRFKWKLKSLYFLIHALSDFHFMVLFSKSLFLASLQNLDFIIS